MGASEAVALALADAQKLPPYDRNFVRYLWCPDAKFKAVNLALNVVSRGVAVVRAVPLGGGRLLRVDARLYARFDPNSQDGHNQDIDDFLHTWEELRYDPSFSLLVTKDNANFAKGDFRAAQPADQKPAKQPEPEIDRRPADDYFDGAFHWHDEGKWQGQFFPAGLYAWQNGQWVKKPEPAPAPQPPPVQAKIEDVLRYNPDYLDPQLTELQKTLYTEAPIVQDSYFMARALHTVKNDGDVKDLVWATIWGGLYFEFRGVRRSKQQGVTDEDLFFRDFGGIDNAEALFDRLQSDQRAAMRKSEVTGKKRRVDFFNLPNGKAWDMMGIGSVTHDLNDKDIDVSNDPLKNLLKVKDSAREAIFVGSNGMHIYAIFDGKGKLLDEADINAVSDRTVPAPHSPKLQCAMSCISCHEAEGSDGWKDVKNQVKEMLAEQIDPLTGRQMLRPDIVADLNAKDQIGAINRIAGLYAGDFRKGIRRGRDDYAQVILKASGPQGDDQLKVVKTGMGEVVNRTRNYLYGPGGNGVDPRQALWELGVEPGPVPTQTLQAMLPPEPAKVGGFLPEDPNIIGLLKGQSLSRYDWAFTHSFAASRVHKHKAGGNK